MLFHYIKNTDNWASYIGPLVPEEWSPGLEADAAGGGDGGVCLRSAAGHTLSQLADGLTDPSEQTPLHHRDQPAGYARDAAGQHGATRQGQ